MKAIKRVLGFLALLMFSCQIFADVQSPVSFVDHVASQMIANLASNKSQLKQLSVVRGIVDRVLIPNIDLDRLSGSVVGRQYWAKASAQQRSVFIREFTRYVVSTYASALASYDNDKVRVYPFRGNYTQSAVVRVNSIIVRRSGQTIPISYNLIRRNGGWKIYDFSIENVSMAESYRSQFSDTLAQAGLSGLIQKLQKRS